MAGRRVGAAAAVEAITAAAVARTVVVEVVRTAAAVVRTAEVEVSMAAVVDERRQAGSRRTTRLQMAARCDG